MKQAKSIWVIVIFLAGFTIAGASLQISAATDKPVYQLGETVKVFVSVYNPTSTSVTMHFPSALRASYVLDNTYDWTQGKIFLEIPSAQSIAPSQTLTWQLNHGVAENTEYFLGVGVHSVKGYVYSYETIGQFSEPFEFQVVPEPMTISLLAFGFLLLRRPR